MANDKGQGLADGRAISLLVVCTGNICRSPTGEGVLRHLVKERGLAGRVRIASAGTHGYHVGEAPDPRTLQHASKRGYDLSRQRAMQVEKRHFDEFDYILAMDRGHLRVPDCVRRERQQHRDEETGDPVHAHR